MFQFAKCRRALALAIAGVFTVTALAACGDSSDDDSASADAGESPDNGKESQAELTSVKVALFTPGLVDTVVYIGEHAGLFAKNGLDIDFVPVATGPALTAALLGGSVQFADTASALSWPVLEDGSGCMSYLSSLGRNGIDLIAKPGITTLEELQGKTVGVTARGTLSEALVRTALGEAGLDPDGVTYIAVGGPAAAQVAFSEGQVDSITAVAPIIDLLPPDSFELVGNFSGANADEPGEYRGFVQNFQATSCEYAEENPEIVEQFCRGLWDTFDYMKDPSSTDEVGTLLAELLGTSADVSQQVWSRYRVLYESPEITPELWEAQLDYLPADMQDFVPEFDEYVHDCAVNDPRPDA